MAKLDAISKSRYNTFQDNPFHYFLNYERGLGLNPNNPYLRRGSIVHEALEHVWKFVDGEYDEDDLWLALEMCASEVDFEKHSDYEEDEHFKSEHIEEFDKFFKNWITVQMRLKKQHGSRSVPEKLEYPMWNKQTEIRGIADAVYKFEDGWYIVDYKTGSITDNKLGKYYAEELALYQHLWESTQGEKVAGVGIMGLKNGKLCSDTFDEKFVEKVVDKARHYLKLIRNDQFPINVKDDHYMSDYSEICPFGGHRNPNKQRRWMYLEKFGTVNGDPYNNEIKEWQSKHINI